MGLLKLSGLPDQPDGLPPVIDRRLPRTRKMKALLIVSIVTNLGLLAIFKYTGFVAENLNALAASLGAGPHAVPVLHVVLPVGISFYTFKAMSYAIDVYRGEARPMRRFTDYLCFEAFFPDLVAGPIIRYAALEEQMRVRRHTLDKFARGVAFFAFGMAKKILLANPMGHVADTAFAAGTLHAPDAWFGLVGYAFQIYFDFSGYSDMACGLALMMGFVLIQNFDSPYQSDSITDFWRRWHISLSTWLRDYLYVPLGGNRHGRRREYRNLMLTMLLGGLWHGARWTFVAWGLYHGLILCIYRLAGIRDVSPREHFGRWLVRVVVMFHLTCAGWLLFRADHFGAVARAASLMATHFVITQTALTAAALITFYAGALFILELVTDGEGRIRRLLESSPAVQGAVYGYLVSMTLFFHARRAYEFLYFQF